jgi:hypothetical protein
MGKIFCLVSMVVMAYSLSASATTININMTGSQIINSNGSVGSLFSGDLYHDNAYYWRVNVNTYLSTYAPGEVLDYATLTVQNINNTPEPDNSDTLFMSLLDVNKPYLSQYANQIKIYTDDTQANYFSNTKSETDEPFNNYIAKTDIATYSDANWYFNQYNQLVNPTQTQGWVIAGSLIDAYKNDAASSGFVGIGLDPDCHYSGKIILTLTTKSASVPEPGSVSLMLLGLTSLAGALFMRRKNK